jgi:hypothetical protein
MNSNLPVFYRPASLVSGSSPVSRRDLLDPVSQIAEMRDEITGLLDKERALNKDMDTMRAQAQESAGTRDAFRGKVRAASLAGIASLVGGILAASLPVLGPALFAVSAGSVIAAIYFNHRLQGVKKDITATTGKIDGLRAQMDQYWFNRKIIDARLGDLLKEVQKQDELKKKEKREIEELRQMLQSGEPSGQGQITDTDESVNISGVTIEKKK